MSMTDAEIAAKKAELRGKISALSQKKGRVIGLKARLQEQKNKLNATVHSKVIRYDLTASEHWKGNLQKSGEDHRTDLSNSISNYKSEIDDVLESVDFAINKIESEISGLEAELASL